MAQFVLSVMAEDCAMKRAILAGLCITLSATVACGGGNDESAIAERTPEVSGRGSEAPTLVTATGCVTASGDQFVLTELESGAAGSRAQGQEGGAAPAAAAQPTTESYQLVGNADELRKLVGRQVQVSGAAEPPKVAEVREMTPPTEPAKPGTATGTSGAPEPAKPGEPQVATTTETRLEVTQLRVETITETGQACATGGQPQR